MTPEVPEFVAELSREDPLGRALRAALHAERLFNEYLELRLPHPDKLGDRFTFDQKLRIAEALGFEPRLVLVARTINQERNRFAHELSATLDQAKLKEAARKLEEISPGLFGKLLPAVQPGCTGFDDQSVEDMLTSVALCLYSFGSSFLDHLRRERRTAEHALREVLEELSTETGQGDASS